MNSEQIVHYQLDNGFNVVLENIPFRNSATMGIWVPMGSRFEKTDEAGYCHFVEHMLFKGTENRSYSDISKAVDRLGGYMNASTSREVTNYYITFSSADIPIGLDVLSDMFFNSKFADAEYSVEKKVILEEIKMGEDNPDEYLFDLFYNDAFGKTSVGRNIAGSIQTIEESTRDGLYKFYNNNYGTQGSVISLAGGLWNNEAEKKALQKTIEKFFNQSGHNEIKLLGKPSMLNAGEANPVQAGVISHHKKPLEQVHFALALPGLPVTMNDDVYLEIYNHAMGGTMSSRLFSSLREKNGLCYSVGSFHSQYMKEGIWGIYCGTSKESFYQALDLAIAEVQNSLNKFIGENEIHESKTGIAGSMRLGMESPMRRAGYNAKSIMYFNQIRDWRLELKKIEDFDYSTMESKIKDLWRDHNFTITSLGDFDSKEVEERVQAKNMSKIA